MGFRRSKVPKWELIYFLLMYLFVQQADSGKAPIESILPRARGMPFYQLVNDSLKVIVGLADVKQKVRMVDFEAAECLTSQP